MTRDCTCAITGSIQDVFDAAKSRIETKINQNLAPHKSTWDSDSDFVLNENSKKAHCTDGTCYNRYEHIS